MYERDEFPARSDPTVTQPGTSAVDTPCPPSEIAACATAWPAMLLPPRHQGRRAYLQLHCVHCRPGHASRRPRHRAPGPTSPWRRYAVDAIPASGLATHGGWSPGLVGSNIGHGARRPTRSNDTNCPCMATTRSSCWAKEGKTPVAAQVSDRPCRTAPAGPYRWIDAHRFGRLSSRIDPSSWFVLGADPPTRICGPSPISPRAWGRNSAGILYVLGSVSRHPGPGAGCSIRHLPRSCPKVDHHAAISVTTAVPPWRHGHLQEHCTCGCADRGVSLLGGWCLRCRHHRIVAGLALTGLRRSVVLNDSTDTPTSAPSHCYPGNYRPRQLRSRCPSIPICGPGSHRYEPL